MAPSSPGPSGGRQQPVPQRSRTVIQLVIRFSLSIPDVPINLGSPSSVNIANIKKQIREQLPEEYRDYGLRLIYGGRVLGDSTAVAEALRLRQNWVEEEDDDEEEENDTIYGTSTQSALLPKGKGKEPVRDIESTGSPEAATLSEDIHPRQRFYLHCSLTAGPLSPTALAAELDASKETALAPPASSEQHGTSGTPSSQSSQQQGFDRLLSTAGFTQADVTSLRAQFRATIASRHTPDTMPTAQALLRMEERWLDASTGTAGLGASNASNGPVGGADDEEDASGMLNDTLIGAIIGFFWPLGAAAWGLREDGVWSGRRQVAVLAGLLVNVGFGFLRLVN